MRYATRNWMDQPRHSPWSNVILAVIFLVLIWAALEKVGDLEPVPSTPVEVLD